MKDKINEKYVQTKTQLAQIRAQKLKGVKTSVEIQGTGPLNRDGVPAIPPEQREVKNWPVLDLGIQPEIELKDWKLNVHGLCERPQVFTAELFQTLPVVTDESDFHCVTGWSRRGIHWRGVRLKDLADYVGMKEDAKHVYFTSSDNYSTNLTIDEALKDDVLLVFEAEGKPLAREHGGPVRVITPQLWAWKGAKWISGIEFLAKDRRGFWEERGYSNSAVPWLNDRYTADEVTE